MLFNLGLSVHSIQLFFVSFIPHCGSCEGGITLFKEKSCPSYREFFFFSFFLSPSSYLRPTSYRCMIFLEGALLAAAFLQAVRLLKKECPA
ncbi:hypothetical protein CSUI_007398 [Cystoisospora suis]|uniref:Transmembrane protein n=1 Tax=Cystoisospora suis TaxID=483139 RepID=A0A2C6KNS9_9APIC|nr:hypothetical protein CSUI_007398 [Cystoisospora suis]